jgi:hypothetical protein
MQLHIRLRAITSEDACLSLLFSLTFVVFTVNRVIAIISSACVSSCVPDLAGQRVSIRLSIHCVMELGRSGMLSGNSGVPVRILIRSPLSRQLILSHLIYSVRLNRLTPFGKYCLKSLLVSTGELIRPPVEARWDENRRFFSGDISIPQPVPLCLSVP